MTKKKKEQLVCKVSDMLHNHCREILIEGKNRPLVRRGIKQLNAGEIIKYIRHQTIKEIEKDIQQHLDSSETDDDETFWQQVKGWLEAFKKQ